MILRNMSSRCDSCGGDCAKAAMLRHEGIAECFLAATDQEAIKSAVRGNVVGMLELGVRGGVQGWCLNGAEVKSIESAGAVIRTWRDADAEWCFIGDVYPADPKASRADQTQSCLERLASALDLAGMTFEEVMRTWFFNNLILEWYGDFNRVRTNFFSSMNLKRLPASTGVGMPNRKGAELTCAALAMRPLRPGAIIREVVSPLQGPATAYRSSFSRAMAIESPEQRRMWISGTASIDPAGLTQYPESVDRQIDRTLEVVQALLGAEDMGWQHVTRAVGYFRHEKDIAKWEAHAAKWNLQKLPVALVEAYVCRDDLLFELEADAVRMTSDRIPLRHG